MKTYSVFDQNSQEFVAKGVTIHEISNHIPVGSKMSVGSRPIRDTEGKVVKEVRGALYTLLSTKILVTED